MTVTQDTDLYWDPYEIDLNMDPYPLFKRLRDEALHQPPEVADCSGFECRRDLRRQLGGP